MSINKSIWHTGEGSISIDIPFSKVDVEHRTVSGFATLDNVDQSADIIPADASNKAFERFRGNVREMHQSIAVGKMLSFSQQDFYDIKDDKIYRGIFVTAYVSRGAQDTWEKVLDGTLSGFSIGGNILDSEVVYSKEYDKTVRVIKEYDLVELSLVDSPCNPLANVFSVVKSASGTTYSGIATGTSVENVFYCKTDEIAVTSVEEDQDCASCGKAMENIGWVEETNSVEKTDIVRDVVRKYIKPEITKQAESNHEGGNEVSKVDNTSVEEVEPVTKADETVEEVAVETAEVSEVSEESADVEKADADSDVEVVETPDFVKLFDDLKTFVSEAVEKNITASSEQIDSIKESVDTFTKAVDDRFAELEKGHNSLTETYERLVESLGKVEESVERINSSTAVKKSSELGGSEEVTKTNSIWGGRFLGVSDL
jgi:hypothetical protein